MCYLLHFEGLIPLLSDFHGFWWTVSCNFIEDPHVCDTMLLSRCLQDSLSVSQQLYCDASVCGLLTFTILGVYWAWVCRLMIFIKFGKFSAFISLSLPALLLARLLCTCWYTFSEYLWDSVCFASPSFLPVPQIDHLNWTSSSWMILSSACSNLLLSPCLSQLWSP